MERAQTFLNYSTPQTRAEVLKLVVQRHPLQVDQLLYGLPTREVEALLRLITRAKQDLGLLPVVEQPKAIQATLTFAVFRPTQAKVPDQPGPEAVSAAVSQLVQLSQLGGASGGAITAQLHGLSPAVRSAVLRQLQHAHPQTWAKLKLLLGSLDPQDASAKLSPYDYAERLCGLLDHPSPEHDVRTLVETAQRHGKVGQVADAYRRMFGQDLAEALGSHLNTSGTRQHVFALLQLNKPPQTTPAQQAVDILRLVASVPEALAGSLVPQPNPFGLQRHFQRDMIVRSLIAQVGFDLLQQAYLSVTKRDLLTDFDRECRDAPDFPLPGLGEATLTRHVFFEQVVKRMAYMNDADLAQVNLDRQGPFTSGRPAGLRAAPLESQLEPAKLLHIFGYGRTEVLHGKWGV